MAKMQCAMTSSVFDSWTILVVKGSLSIGLRTLIVLQVWDTLVSEGVRQKRHDVSKEILHTYVFHEEFEQYRRVRHSPVSSV